MIDSTSTTTALIRVGPGLWSSWGGGGGYADFGPDFATTQEHPRTMAILTIDIANKKKQPCGRGQATVDHVANNQKGDEKQIAKCVEKMFQKLPPKGD